MISISAVLIFSDIMTDLSERQTRIQNPPTYVSFSLGFGTMLFIFGGISAFPTIQNDMREQHKFPRSVCLAYLGK